MNNISRTWAMPSSQTFSIKPIDKFIRQYIGSATISIDPFCGASLLATYRNDLCFGVDAEDYCDAIFERGIICECGLFDPPYSTRQISECYKSVGLKIGKEETQNSRLYRRVRDAMDRVIKKNGFVLSFGWNSSGMGKGRNYEIVEILIVNHGSAHNDTICVAEIKR